MVETYRILSYEDVLKQLKGCLTGGEAEYNYVKLHIDSIPPITPYKWTPVIDGLPKAEYGESDSVLVCFEDETQDVLYFNGSNWCYPTGETYISVNHKNGWHNKVIAWMPLPTRYKAEEENK